MKQGDTIIIDGTVFTILSVNGNRAYVLSNGMEGYTHFKEVDLP